uniref:CCHC-type domain-containing protein n=1 Tax=Salmo trutta TaxID=8032 RepID=A0A674DHB6_SALTR
MDAEEIVTWCREKQLAINRAFVHSNVTEDMSDEVLLETLTYVKAFGKIRLHGRSYSADKKQYVLVEISNNLNEIAVPSVVGIPGELGPWPVHVVSQVTSPVEREGEDFQAKLLSFLRHEGKTVADVKGLVSPSGADLNTELVIATSSLVEKCNNVPSETQSYRKLRMFSGVKPTPSGEEEYDAWAEQTTHFLEEWQCADNVKKQRIIESLKGPAADIVRFFKTGNPHATAIEYMKALETAFGTTESAPDLMVRFRNTFQNEGEKLSAYLLRLDKLLHAVYRKGGIELSEMNRTRIGQIVRGASSHDMVALRIRMTYKLREPPTFTELMQEVREEDMIQDRNTTKSVVKSSAVAPVATVCKEANSEIEVLRKELNGLKTEMTQQTQADSNPGVFCYRCGEDGHFKRNCEGEENLRKVNTRLIKQKRSMGNYRGTHYWNSKVSWDTFYSSHSGREA